MSYRDRVSRAEFRISLLLAHDVLDDDLDGPERHVAYWNLVLGSLPPFVRRDRL